MAKWSYLRRAYAIQEYAIMRQTEAENKAERTEDEANSLKCVLEDIKRILGIAESWLSESDSSYDDYHYYCRTKQQCKKFLKDFLKENLNNE